MKAKYMSTPKPNQKRQRTTLFGIGDALRGDRVAINARRISDPQVINQSGEHRSRAVIARDNVFCVIEMPLSVRPKSSSA